jgi:hypothetical protein
MLLGEALLLWYAQRRQDTVGQIYQPSVWSQEPCRLGNPVFGVAPDAGTVLADHQIEARVREWHVLGVALDQGKHQPKALLATTGCVQLRRGQVDADGPGTLPGQQARQIGCAAAQLEHIQSGDVAEDARVALGSLSCWTLSCWGGGWPGESRSLRLRSR